MPLMSSAAMILCALIGTPAAHAEIHVYQFPLSGAQEVSPNASPATGQCMVTLDDIQRTLAVDCSYAGLQGPSTAAHVYVGQPDQSGVVMLTLAHSSAGSGTASGFFNLFPNQISLILSGGTFVRVHSAAHPGGEIRGQIANPPPPQSLYIFGLEHTAIGSASLTARDIDDDGFAQTLIINNIGSSGNDGVSLRLGPVNGGIERPGVQGWFGTIQHMPGTPAVTIEPRNILKTYFETGDIPTEDQLIVNYCGNGALGSISHIHSPHLAVESLHISLHHNGRLIDATDPPVPPAGALVTGSITEGEPIEFMDKAMLVDIVLHATLDKLLIVPIAMEKELRFNSPRMLSILGRPPVLADQIAISVVYQVVSSKGDVSVKIPSVEVTAVANGAVHLHKEGIIHRDIACRALGDAHIVGEEVCDRGGCEDALILENLGSSGNDGVSFRTIKSRAGSLIPFDDRDHSRQISFLPITLASGDELRIGSEWCSGPGDDDDCDSAVSMWCALEGTATGVSILADFSGAGTTAKAIGRRNGSVVNADFNHPSSFITPLPGETVQIISATDSDHITGQYMAGFVWKFAGEVQLEVPGQPPVLIDELQLVSATPLKKEEGGRHTPFHNRWQPSGIGHTIVIKGVQPAQSKFEHGWVFGLEHTAMNGAAMSIASDSQTIEGLALRVTPPAQHDPLNRPAVAITLGESDGMAIRFGTGVGKTDMEAVLRDTANAVVGGWIIRDVEDPQGISLPEIMVAAGLAGGLALTIELLHNNVPVATLNDMPDSTVMKLVSGQPKIVDNQKGLLIDFYITPSGGASPVVEINGQQYIANKIKVRPVSSGAQLPVDTLMLMLGEEVQEVIIVEEFINLREEHHTGTGAARLLAVADVNGDSYPDLALSNPSNGPTVSGIYSEKASFGGMTGIGHPNYAMAVDIDDPCAGLPPDCIGWPDGASVSWTVMVSNDDLTTNGNDDPDVGITLHATNIDQNNGHFVDLYADTSGMGASTYLLQMFLDGELIDDVPDYSGPLQMTDANGGNNINWSFGGGAVVGNVAMHVTVNFVDARYILRSGVPLLTPVLCDELRFTVHPNNLALGGIVASHLTTRDVPLIDVTDMQFGEPTPVCPADVAPPGGDQIVGVPDLLKIISSWGACAPGDACVADIAPAGPPMGDGSVGVPDLLRVISSWGPCAN